jgi:putative redox protein
MMFGIPMTPTESPATELLVLTAHLESGAAPYAQRVQVGNHVVPSDEPASRGGADAGPSPTGLVLAGLAACTSITLRMYADRKGWELGTVHVDLKLLRTGAAERIERTIRLGAALAPEQQARLLEIADKTPVTKMLKAGLPIATTLH